MSTLRIALSGNQTAYRPGGQVRGTVDWSFVGAAPRMVELRLFWFTCGHGTQDVSVVENMRFDRLRAREERPFCFLLPYGPYSFRGEFVSLTWALELVADSRKTAARVEIVLSPSGVEIELGPRSQESANRSLGDR